MVRTFILWKCDSLRSGAAYSMLWHTQWRAQDIFCRWGGGGVGYCLLKRFSETLYTFLGQSEMSF